MSFDPKDPQALDRLRDATDLLDQLSKDASLIVQVPIEDRKRLLAAVTLLFNPSPSQRRNMVKASKRKWKAERIKVDEDKLHETGIRELRRRPTFTTPNVYPPKELHDHPERVEDSDAAPRDLPQPALPQVAERHCYVCKQHHSDVHFFYDQMCVACGDFNYFKRNELANLRGRVALLTGGRVKIGYQAGLKLLRCGAHLIVTTRFPKDSASRYSQEPDFADWADRLEIHGLDLRHTPSVEAFCTRIQNTHARLDFIINNACQTVRRPPEFYKHMMEHERTMQLGSGNPVSHLVVQTNDESFAASHMGLTHAAELSQVALLPEDLAVGEHLFPSGALDQDMQQVDLRGRNSWRLLLNEVSTVELLEVQLVNSIAPFVLNARLKDLMNRTPDRDKHVVNVSAMEGQFYRNFKTTRHPHTNMAKAALNMMTRTSAADYFQDGIHMNSVDTGWITDEDPAEIAARKTAEQRFHPPLDILDGGARIVDPIISGVNTGNHVWGKFLKDYKETDW